MIGSIRRTRRWTLAAMVVLSSRSAAPLFALRSELALPAEWCSAAPPLELRLNLPAFRLDAYRNGERIRSYRVAVGEAAYPTPVGAFSVTRIEWRPSWIPPNSPWVTADTLVPPGPANPMGRVKLQFGALYYLHGTPDEASLGGAKSHGCVRMANKDAVDLARLVEHYGAEPADTDTVMASPSNDSASTRVVRLVHAVPLLVTYHLAEVSEGRLTVFPDIYDRAAGQAVPDALAALLQAGYPAAVVDTARVRRLAESVTRKPVSAPVGQFLGPQISTNRAP